MVAGAARARADGRGRRARATASPSRYSFGPYVQFWASYEGAQEAGALVIPLGGMESVQRLETMREYGATVLLCTPSYALHLARVAGEHGLLGALEPVARVVCTGEPGASMPAVRDRIEAAWGARCLDHAGASEVGSLAYPCAEHGGAAPVRGRVRLRGARPATPASPWPRARRASSW